MKRGNAWHNISKLNYSRGLVLMGFGAVVGLVLAAVGLFTAKGTSTLIVPPEDVALVNQQPIVRSDYLAQLRTLYDVDYEHATPQQRRKVLDDMIREELFVQRGTELDVASADPATRMAMVSAVEQQAATDAMTDLPNDEKLRRYYEANKARYSSDGYMTARDIVFAAPPDTLAAARAMTPEQAMAKFGAKESGKLSAQEFYFAADVHIGRRLALIAEALPNGAVSAPVIMPDGTHLIYMIKNVRPVPLDFEKAKAQILADYRRESSQRMLAHEQMFLRERANILIAKDMQ
jgi:parvulin-like peptidyl-prolyl isomerase